MDFYRPPTSQGVVDALATLYRALRAWRFYPKGHPNRRSSVMHAHSSMLEILDGHDLSMSCGRTSFSFPDGEILRDNTRLSTALSYELFVRRVQKITFQKDLYQEDLLALLRILALSPDIVQNSGGVDNMMARHGVRSIWANEFDLSVIRSKRRVVESGGITPQSFDETEAVDETDPAFAQQPISSDDIPPEQMLPVLLGRLTTAIDDDIYMMLVRQAISCCESLKSRRELLPLFPLIELLASHAEDAGRNENIREFARFAIEQISTGREFAKFVLGRMAESDRLSQAAILEVVSTGGANAVVLAVEQLGLTNNLAVRKAISNLLARLGDGAVPPLLKMLEDKRWFIVRNIVAVLGVIACQDSVPGLIKCLQHSDIRVCKEAIRSLAKIGGREAESALIAILQYDNQSLYPQVIASLGGLQSRKALAELMRIVLAKDMFLTSLALKVDALTAIAMIGDRQVTPQLIKVLTSRHLLAGGRCKQLKIAVAHCLGRLGDPQVLPELISLSSAAGELGTACLEAVAAIERGGASNGGA